MRSTSTLRPTQSTKASSSVRIIGGQWKRSLLPVANAPGLRPTPDRVRETVFNWINHQCGGGLEGLRVLDLFAGSGALGFEAASRGAAQVVLCEQDADLVESLHAVQTRLKASNVEIEYTSALTMLQSIMQQHQHGHGSSADATADSDAGSGFDLIFLDPPYRQGWLDKLWPLLHAVLNSGGLVYAEAETALTQEAMAIHGLTLIRADKAGQVFYHLLRKIDGPIDA